jgi:antitoxin component of MazEF toxin-antitoxin module
MSENEQLPEDKPTLEDLVARITEDNRRPEGDWGEPVGEEIW